MGSSFTCPSNALSHSCVAYSENCLCGSEAFSISLCPLPLNPNCTSIPTHLFEPGVQFSFYAPGELMCEGKVSLFPRPVASALPDLCRTTKTSVQASGLLFWAIVQLSVRSGPVKSFINAYIFVSADPLGHWLNSVILIIEQKSKNRAL